MILTLRLTNPPILPTIETDPLLIEDHGGKSEILDEAMTPIEQETSAQEAESEAASDGIDPKYIYIASGVVILGAIGAAIVVKNKRASKSRI